MSKGGRLRRRKAFREPKSRFTILCEGKNTEPQYFGALKAHYRDALISVEVVPAVGVPLTIAKRAIQITKSLGIAGRRKKRNSFELRDAVWAVFDRDTHPNYKDAITLCEANRVGVARSDPCFELWLVLHLADYDKPDGQDVVQARLRELCPEYDPAGKKNVDCKKLVGAVESAETRARLQLELRVAQGNKDGRPSTTVGALTMQIREAAKQAGSR